MMHMRLEEARKATSTQLSVLSMQKDKLTKLLQETPKEDKNFDRVEISKQLQEVEKVYDMTQEEAGNLSRLEMGLESAESAKQQGEAMAKHMKEEMENMLKCMEIYRRIADGGKVPSTDETRLMEYNSALYVAAKNMAMMNRDKDGKEYDSLWDEEESAVEGETPSPSEIAGNTGVSLDLPECPKVTVDISTEG